MTGDQVIKAQNGTTLPPLGATFERLVWISFGFAVLQGALQIMPSLEVNGWAISLMKLFVSPVLSLLLALAVSRLRSRIAAVVFILSLTASLVLAYLDIVEDYWRNLPFAIGATSIVVDVVAAAIIVRWLVKSEL
ncbi:hypothetical protein [Erythrobacter sp. R86502]|uniref:hypothetical protein n=1 Tax=Erythrobacter sp. R86502 TaxID=3093846 RepID=UPI0036D2BD1A